MTLEQAAAIAAPRPRFQDEVCLVTGGSRGIGRAIATALVSEGAYVAIASRNETECQAAAELLGPRSVSLPTDVTDMTACVTAVHALTRRFGSPSILINAAGISPVHQRAELQEAATFDEIVRVNLSGAYAMTRAVSHAMLERGRGAVVMVASAVGLAASPRLSAYGASKAGLIHLTKTLAREWGGFGVRVNAVCPGYAETAMTRALLQNDRLRQRVLTATPLGRLAMLDEIVAPTLFLASSEASYITGATLTVDGGLSA